MVENKLASFYSMYSKANLTTWKYPGNLSGGKQESEFWKKASCFEKIVKKHPLMVIIIVLPYLNSYEMARFCQFNRAC